MTVSEVHIGKIIKQVVTDKGIRTGWLAKQLHCNRNNIYKIYGRPWIDTLTLAKLSKILDYDFFAQLSECYNGTETENQAAD